MSIKEVLKQIGISKKKALNLYAMSQFLYSRRCFTVLFPDEEEAWSDRCDSSDEILRPPSTEYVRNEDVLRKIH